MSRACGLVGVTAMAATGSARARTAVALSAASTTRSTGGVSTSPRTSGGAESGTDMTSGSVTNGGLSSHAMSNGMTDTMMPAGSVSMGPISIHLNAMPAGTVTLRVHKQLVRATLNLVGLTPNSEHAVDITPTANGPAMVAFPDVVADTGGQVHKTLNGAVRLEATCLQLTNS